jgi:hypothetical protein
VYDILLMLHFIGLSLAFAAPFFMKALASHASTLMPEERPKLMLGAGRNISKVGSMGLAFLIGSGVPMLIMRGSFSQYEWPFFAKMILVLVLIVYVGIMQMLMAKARRSKESADFIKLKKMGNIGPFLGTATLIFAVLTFH